MEHKDIIALTRGIGPVIKDAIQSAMAPVVARLVALENRPTEKGEPGMDGFSLEHFDASTTEDPRVIELSFTQGDVRHSYELQLPIPVYRGVWKDGTYQQGDIVTWGGSALIATKETCAKPETKEAGDD